MDLAVLKVEPKKPLPAISFGDSDKARVGEWVIAIGNPYGLGGSVSAGIISARARDINAGPYDDFLQTDAAVNRGRGDCLQIAIIRSLENLCSNCSCFNDGRI